jgi:hypothetical protein
MDKMNKPNKKKSEETKKKQATNGGVLFLQWLVC